MAVNGGDSQPGAGRSDRHRQVAAGWLLALIILASPTLIVVLPRAGDIPILVALGFIAAMTAAAVAAAALIVTLRGQRVAWAPLLAAIAIVASLALATAAGVLTA